MNTTDEIVKNLIKNRFQALMKGNYHKPARELIKVTREMGYYDLAEELEITASSLMGEH